MVTQSMGEGWEWGEAAGNREAWKVASNEA